MNYGHLDTLKRINIESPGSFNWIEIHPETQITSSDRESSKSIVWASADFETKLVIKSYSSIANGCNFFLGSNHDWKNITTYLFVGKRDSLKNLKSNGNIVVGHDVWIGYGATILSGVTIGDGAVVAGGSVVTKDVEPYSIVGGNPAKPISKRFSDEIIDLLIEVKWWNWPADLINQNMEVLSSTIVDEIKKIHDSLKQ